ncbi:MAG: hypothetical protein PHH49_02510 [Candidatus Omnitrophica bacterium]|nr:hypothetical protein [Candidatus Omnitrophota bacterium]MDD5487820.1 hypothetical protein [Candidatus Omnitrophota bacterium]
MGNNAGMKNMALAILLSALSVGVANAVDIPELHGFLEEAFAPRFGEDNTAHRQFNMAEGRLQLKTKYYVKGDNILADWQTVLTAKADLVLDMYYGGKVVTDLRELNAVMTPMDIMDLKIGRQVLTWGTGDYLFLNDLFPKDYESFFIGRDDEYLKAPSDALRVMLYPEWFNVDVAIIPFFRPNILPDGQRVSFFDSFQGGIAGRNSHRTLDEPARQFRNFIYAGRIYRNFSSYEAALYYYRGFDPSPRSYKDEAAMELFYERLDAYGASVRGPVMGGIGNAEVSYYYSPQDNAGKIRTVQNSMVKYLVGYEKDMGGDLRISAQYYLEETLDYDEYRKALLPNDYRWDEFRHTITGRITKLLANQTVKLSLFTFFSPSDLDVYTRPSITWNATDSWTLTIGANLPWGKDPWTDFGSDQKNKNVYVRLRYSF